jgi:hypothetical protein
LAACGDRLRQEMHLSTIIFFTSDFTMTYFVLPESPAEIIGVLGFFIYVLTYSLLTLRAIGSASMIYFILNLAAASFVLIGLTVSFNLASALIQLFWVTMSLIGIMLQFLRPLPR